MMAYRMTHLTDDVRVGINSSGDLNVEVERRHPNSQPSDEIEEIFIPSDALAPLFEYLRRAA